MLAELVSVPTRTTPLDGLFYARVGAPASHAAMLMHGNGMNFYREAPRFLPPHLLDRNIASLAYNRHGHDTVSAATRQAEGNVFQFVAEAIDDNERAAEYLGGRGFAGPVVIGHSNGGHAGRTPRGPAPGDARAGAALGALRWSGDVASEFGPGPARR